MATYRGIKVTPENTHVEKAKAQPGIYRGIKHDAEPSKSKKATNGIYRGVKSVSYTHLTLPTKRIV